MNSTPSQSIVCDIKNSGDRLDPKFYCLEGLIKNRLKRLSFGKKEPIEDVAFVRDGDHGKRLYVDDGIPYLRITNIEEGKISLDREKTVYILKETHKKLKRAHVKPNDVLIPIMGTVGNVVVTVPKYFQECNSNRALARITIKDDYKGEIIPKYIEAYLSTPFGQLQMLRISRGSIQARINFGDINSIILLIPDKDTLQKEIAIMWSNALEQKNKKMDEAKDILNSIDCFILSKLKIDLTETMENTYLCELKNIYDRLDPLNHNPWYKKTLNSMRKSQTKGNYELERIRDVAEFSKDVADVKKRPTEYFRYIEIENVNPDTGEITFQWVLGSDAPSRAKRLLKRGDIVISTNDPIRGSMGIIQNHLNNSVGTSGFIVVRPIKNEITLNYLCAILKSSVVLNQMNRWKTGSTQVAISEDNFKEIMIPIPKDKKIENEIGTKSIFIRDKIKNLRQEAEDLMHDVKEKIMQTLKMNSDDN